MLKNDASQLKMMTDLTSRAPFHEVPTSFFRAGFLSLVLILLLGTTGCGMTGSASNDGGNGSGGATALTTTPIDLPPGQTVAPLGWEPSEGPVDSYLVFESRNNGLYTYSQTVESNQANISGSPGESVRVTVVAVSENGELSSSSAPSPPVNFYAADPSAAATSAIASAPSAAAPTSLLSANDTSTSTSASASATPVNANDEAADRDVEVAEADDAKESLLVRTIRAMLLGGDTRLPESGLSEPASDWLQAQVDEEINANVALAGTGRLDGDHLRELVWQDDEGQLFISDGRAFLDSADLPSTLGQALQLKNAERFVGLADFDGDGTGDWLLEDADSGEVWVVNGANDESQSVSLPASQDSAEAVPVRLAGHGDFDGDGRTELLWHDGENGLEIARPGDEDARVSRVENSPGGFELLAIADLDGDGRDDLLGRSDNGEIMMALSQMVAETEGAPIDPSEEALSTVDWQVGVSDPTEDLELVATLDFDEDGAAEIAWLNGDTLEIWSPDSGLDLRVDL